MEPIDHPVSRYATDVLEGKIITGELVRLSCERHLLDLEAGADRGLIFDCDAANQILNFSKMIAHTKGEMAGKPITLQPWQEFRHGSVFGWKKPRDFVDPVTGVVTTKLVRRFRSTYHQVGKKNGKTTDTAIPALFTQLFDGEMTPEGYCAATTRDQAGLLFKDLRLMVRASPVLKHLMNVWRYTIETPRTQGSISCLSRDGNSTDGINPHFVSRDEVHRWTDRDLAEIVVNSMLSRSQPIDWAITTAGASMASICGEMRKYAEDVVRGDVDDDGFFAYVAEPHEEDDPGDPKTWMMGNPNLGISFQQEDLKAIYNKALAIQGQMPNFRRLHLNLWTEGAQTWIGRDVWDKGSQSFDVKNLYGRQAWVAVDLSRTTDMTAIVVAVPVEDCVYLITYSFLPEGPKGFITRAQTENKSYTSWRDNNWLEVHKGGVIDEDQILQRLEEIRAAFDLQEVAYDPWGMKYLAQELDKRRFPMVEHRQGYMSMSPPMKRFEELVIQNRIRHNGNPVLAWAVGNVHCDVDAAENIKPNKAKAVGRIDPAVAAIMAVGRAAAAQEKRKAREIMFV
ncbi:MAG: terminase [Gammaproteobacteria bacterium]|nr:terminase [Gammaproteobacteria bacterium]